MDNILYEDIKAFILEHGIKEFMLILSEILESIADYL